MDIPITQDDKQVYDLDDFLILDIDNSEIFKKIPLGITNKNFIVDPFQNKNIYYSKSGTLQSDLLLDYGDIYDNVIYLNLASDVLEYSNTQSHAIIIIYI